MLTYQQMIPNGSLEGVLKRTPFLLYVNELDVLMGYYDFGTVKNEYVAKLQKYSFCILSVN